MPTRYVLAVGSSGASALAGAEAWAESHASFADVPLVRVHVVTPDVVAARRHPDEAAAHDPVHVTGRVPDALARFVGADDILVIGTGKTGFIRSRVFGTLSLQIVAEVACTVAVIPDVDLRFRSGVVAGVKDDELVPAIVRASGDEARARREPLHLIQSSSVGLVPAPVETQGTALDRAALAARENGVVRVRTHATARSPAEALLDASRNAALLVIGAGHPRGAGHAIGSVTHDVLVNINAPVLIVRASRMGHAEPDGQRTR
ncbi:universal stress protein [Microbacterium aurugineum]|uniref:universal stress protein n=1 Tax=Microbacterium aurugineum TaxID=2851642 RepID=UPI0022B82511